MPRSAVFAMLASVALSTQAHADDATLYTCKEAPANSKIAVTFNPDTSLQDLATWVLGFSCKNIIIDGEAKRYAPKVTILAPKPMTPKQAMQLFVDSVEATGLVVQMKKDSIIVKLGPKTPRNCPAVADTRSGGDGTLVPLPSATPEPASLEPDELQLAIDAGIRKINDTSYEITTSLVDKVLANPMAVAKGARVVPAVKDGKPDGFKLYAIRPSSVYAKLGLTNGDTIQKINGHELTSADKALEVYTQLRDAKKLVIDLVRRGKPMTLTYKIVSK